MLLAEEVLQGIRADVEASRREGALRSGALKDPDEFAKTDQLAQKMNVPRETVSGNLPKYLQKEKQDTLLLTDFSDTPKLSKFLSNPDNAAQAHDDLDALSGLERVLKGGSEIGWGTRVTDTLRAYAGEFESSIGRAFTGGGGLVRAINESIAQAMPEDIEEWLKTPRDIPQWLDLAGVMERSGQPFIEAGEIIKPPRERETTVTEVAAGLGQLTEQAWMAIMTGGLGSGISLWNMAGMGAEQQISKMKEQGLDVKDDPAAVLMGSAVTMATEQWGLERYLDKVPDVFKNKVSNWVADKLIAGGKEAMQEMVENVSHNLIEQYRYNPKAELFEGVAHEGEIAGYVGIIARMVTSSVMPGRVRVGMERETNRLGKTLNEQNKIEQINEQAAKSKLSPRNNQLFQEYVKSLDEETMVHIPADVLADNYQGKNSEILRQIAEAGELGGDVVIPIDLYAADVARQANIKAIRDHVRLSEESLSKAELEKIDVKKDIGEIFDRLKDEQELVNQAADIYQDVEAKLIESGRIAPQNARIAASIFPGFAAAKAKQIGKTPQEIYDMMGLTVVAEDAIAEPEVFEQAKAEGYEGDSQSEALEWTRAVKKFGPEGMTKEARMKRAKEMGFDMDAKLYAGTGGDQATHVYGFDEVMPFGENYFGGIFSSTDKEIAEGHGSVIQEYLYKDSALLTMDGFSEIADSQKAVADMKDIFSQSMLTNEEAANLIDFASGEQSLFNGDEFVTGNERLASILGYEDVAEMDWRLQGVKGELARRAGYSMVEMEDEHGTSVLILGGNGVRSVNAAFDPDFKESGQLLAQEPQAETARKEKLKTIEVTTTKTIDETGDVVEITERADIAYNRIQERRNAFNNMIKCLRG